MSHRFLPTITLAEAATEITTSKQYLETVIGRPVTSFCYPAGQYTASHLPLVIAAGFLYARTVKRFCFANEGAPFETATSVHTYDHWLDIWPLFRFVRYNPWRFFQLYRRWDVQAKAMFDHVLEHGGIFHLWGHSWEVDGHGDWARLESVLAYIGGHANVHYVTNAEIATKYES
jgi:peptidoglycan/xylan/chitin deacetylase (PgdA/CDA1 family)